MAKTIVVDAGHGGSDPGAVYNGRQEKDDALRLAMLVGQYLTEAGYNVIYTRTTDVYSTPFNKAQIGNESGADLFVSIHRNSAPNQDMYNGIQTLVYNDDGIKSLLARNINRNLTSLGFEDKGVIERPNLVVLKRTRMPAVLVEVGFINSAIDNRILDEKINEVAQAIALGIEETIGGNNNYNNIDLNINNLNSNNNAGNNLIYTVQVGAFRNQYLAYNLATELSNNGILTDIVFEDGLYKVRSGYFSSLDNAAMLENRIKSLGYNAFIAIAQY